MKYTAILLVAFASTSSAVRMTEKSQDLDITGSPYWNFTKESGKVYAYDDQRNVKDWDKTNWKKIHNRAGFDEDIENKQWQLKFLPADLQRDWQY